MSASSSESGTGGDRSAPRRTEGTGAEAGTRGRAGRHARKQVLLRLDPLIYEALARWAGDELRSTNAQIEFLLRRALAETGRLPRGARPIPPRGRPRLSEQRPGADASTDPGAEGADAGPNSGPTPGSRPTPGPPDA